MNEKLLSFLFALLIMGPSFGFSPIMGNLKVNQASCGGESFLWKKHDNVILSGNYLVLAGKFEKDIPVAGEECRFEDRYLRTDSDLEVQKDGTAIERSQLVAQKRIIKCFNYSKSNEAEVSTKEIESPLLRTTIEMEGHDFKMTLEERTLCDGQVVLDLSHNIP
jgi:hypothetical protein